MILVAGGTGRLGSSVANRLSRRGLLRGGMRAAGATALGGATALSGCATVGPAAPVNSLGFTPVAKTQADQVTVPAGYTARVIYALGDPLTTSTPAYKNDGSDADFGNRAGMGNELQAVANKVSMTPAAVAAAGLQALFSGQAELIPGVLNKVSAGLTSVVPKSIVEKIAASIYEKYL